MHSILKIKLIAIIFLFSATCNASQIKLPTDKKLISFLNELFDNNDEFTKAHDAKFRLFCVSNGHRPAIPNMAYRRGINGY